MAKDFLLEIGTEPMPARFIPPALEQLQKNAEALFKEHRLPYAGVKTFGTPRRLAVVLEAVQDKSLPLVKEVLGPPARLLKNEDGSFTAQSEGFARKQGIDPEDLEVKSTPKGDVLCARVTIPGESAPKLLATLLPGLIASLEFPKTLEWESTRFRFGRPIRSLTALLGKKVISFKLAGIQSGRLVSGLAGQGKKPARLSDSGRYRAALKNFAVLVDVEERREALTKRLEQAAKAAGGRLDRDEALLEETVFMTEHPSPIAGKFKAEYLSLPPQLIAMVLKKQLKFFPLLSAGGALQAGFLGVRDGASEGQSQVREGYEKVLAARLSDAAFFISRDAKGRLEDNLPLLSRVTYQKSLGTMAEKAARVEALAAGFCERLRLDPAVVKTIARLAYADLVSEVVKEFPELQGTMGGAYAKRDGLGETVALGLEQFYYPVGAGSPVPSTPEGAAAGLAGKIDTLAGHFALGNVPTGSADPFALRRHATGILRILLEKKFSLDLEAALDASLALQPFKAQDPASARKQLSEFVWTRAQSLFEEMGFKTDEVRSIRAGALQDMPRALLRLSAIQAVRQNPEFEPLAAAFKRASNILKQAQFQEGGSSLERDRLKEEADFKLYDALLEIEGQVQDKIQRGGFEEGLRTLVGLKSHVDFFFEKVMVMVDDQDLKRQRLGLLAKLTRLFYSIADISQIQQASVSSSK